MLKRNLGDMGENFLRSCCAPLGIDVTPPEKDRNGWDFLLEFPPDFTVDGIPRPLDKVDSPLKCWIQVKATDKRRGKWKIKLSNWLRLIFTPYPAFFLVVEFDGVNEPQEAFLVHIGEEYIYQILKKLREVGYGSHSGLHKKRKQFAYRENDRLPSLNSDGIESSIRKHVASTDDYMSWKKGIVENVGYEDGGHMMNVTIVLPEGKRVDPIESLVDLSLGIIPQLETTHVEIKDMRFGIEAPELTKIFNQKGIITMPNKPTDKAIINFHLSDYSREVNVEVDMFVPMGFGFELHGNQRKVRFVAPFIQIIYSSGEGNSNFVWPEFDKGHALLDLHNISQIMLILFEGTLKGVEIRTEIIVKDKKIKGNAGTHIDVPPEIAHAATMVEFAWSIAKYFDIQSKVELSITDVLNQQLILPIHQFLINQNPNFRISYQMKIDSDHKPILTYCPYILLARLGQYVILIVVVVICYPEKSGNKDLDWVEWTSTSNDVHIRRETCFNEVSSEDTQAKARLLLNSVIDPLDDSQQIMISDDIQKLIDEKTITLELD